MLLPSDTYLSNEICAMSVSKFFEVSVSVPVPEVIMLGKGIHAWSRSKSSMKSRPATS